jgi:hypothetical protein
MQGGSLENLQIANKIWQRRLDVVLAMEQWMIRHISRNVVVKGRVLKRRLYEFESKGREYLYCNLLLGKTLFPDGSDELFPDQSFHDTSLHVQLEMGDNGRVLNNGVVEQYWAELRRLRIACGVDGLVDVSSDPIVTRVGLEKYVPYTALRKLNLLYSQLLDKHINEHFAEEHLIGLILRYRCVGGFESNQHGSISSNWGESFSDMVECFASPLNHVFGSYYSVFEQDVVFGSRGNLFRAVDHQALPSSGRFEMNPPFEETILDKAADLLVNTFSNADCNTFLVMFAPDWKDSAFYEKLNSLTSRLSHHSSKSEKMLRYDHAAGQAPEVASLMFVFVGQGRSKVDAMRFIEQCQSMMLGSVADGRDRRGYNGDSGRAASDSRPAGWAVNPRDYYDMRRRGGQQRWSGVGFAGTLERIVRIVM